jgi:hypothetical protein
MPQRMYLWRSAIRRRTVGRKGDLWAGLAAKEVCYPILSIVVDIVFMLAVFDSPCYRFY